MNLYMLHLVLKGSMLYVCDIVTGGGIIRFSCPNYENKFSAPQNTLL